MPGLDWKADGGTESTHLLRSGNVVPESMDGTSGSSYEAPGIETLSLRFRGAFSLHPGQTAPHRRAPFPRLVFSRLAERLRSPALLASLLLVTHPLLAHEGHQDRTYQIRPSKEPPARARVVVLELRDQDGTARLPARFSLELDGQPWTPDFLNEHGIHFTSIHARKKQRVTVLFSRGTGPVRFSVPEEANRLTVNAVRGLQFLPVRETIHLEPGGAAHTIRLRRFVNLGERGWVAADEHLHYERRDPRHDADWLALLRADGLHHGFFLVLKGGNFAGVWAQQYAYGAAGEASDGQRRLVVGEEFRGTMQGHNNLLGPSQVLAPISVGGMGRPPVPFHAPSSHDVLLRTRSLGGIGGPAHGGTFGRASTALVDALTGASEFFELANTHLLETGPWYRVLNCGVVLPPAAGTDLPNFPFREPWQPFFGETRMFVQLNPPADFHRWKAAVRAGRVFVSSGPLLTRFTIDGRGLGESVSLPETDGDVRIEAEVVSPRPLSDVALIHNGAADPAAQTTHSFENGVHRARIERRAHVGLSGWFAVRAFGQRKNRLFAEAGRLQRTMLHSAAIPVRVRGEPVRIPKSVAAARNELRECRELYRRNGRFPDDASRNAMLSLFDEALERLESGSPSQAEETR